MTINRTACYEIADTLGIPVYRVGELIKGSTDKVIRVGPWQLERTITFTSDIVDVEQVSGFARIAGDLWFYLRSNPGAGILTIHLIDAKPIKLSLVTVTNFCRGGDTMRILGEAVKQGYRFDGKDWLREL